MMKVLQKLWSGAYSLPMAFLGFYVFGSWGVIFIAALFALVAALLQFERAGFIAAFLILVAYWFVASVGVWRSAAPSVASDNWAARVEGYAARTLVAMIAAYAVFTLFNGGAAWLMQRVLA